MFDFDGSASSGGKVDLGGRGGRHRARGAGDESRSDFVKRQHKEREARERKRLRDRAATEIQAVWRSWHSRRGLQAYLRQTFDKSHDDIKRALPALAPDVKAKFVFRIIVSKLLRPFAFFFNPREDRARLAVMLELVLFSGAQVAASNVFHLALGEDKQRRGFLALFERLLRATLVVGRTEETARILLALQGTLFSGPPTFAAVDVGKSGQTAAQILRRTQVLPAVAKEVFGHVVAQQVPLQVVELLSFCCAGVEACPAAERPALLECLLSAPRLGPFLCDGTADAVRKCLGRLAALVVTTPPGQGPVVLEAEVGGHPAAEWFLGNLLTIVERHVLLGGDGPTALPAWLEWLCRARQQRQAATPTTRATPAVSEQLDRMHRAAFARNLLQRQDSMTADALNAVCHLYFPPLEAAGSDVEAPAEVLRTLAWSTPFAQRLFPTLHFLVRSNSIDVALKALGAPQFTAPEATRLRVFCGVYALQMQPMYDYEFFGPANPLQTEEVRQLALFLNRLAYQLVTAAPDRGSLAPAVKALRRNVTELVSLLYNRHRRRPILDGNEAWVIPHSTTLLRRAPVVDLAERAQDEDHDPMEVEDEEVHMDDAPVLQAVAPVPSRAAASAATSPERILEAILEEIPHVIPFEDRVTLLHNVIQQDQEQRRDTRGPWAPAAMQKNSIRRTHLVDDGFAAFEALSDEFQLRDVFRVEFIAPDGQPETGVDGGGLFKEFMVHICRTVFDPDFGLFNATGDQTLYPAEGAFVVHGKRTLDMYTFIGKVVGKAIYEMFLLEPQFSRVFLNRLLGRLNEVDDVAALDKELHRNMLRIKESESVSDLMLTFSVSVSFAGTVEEVDLIPDGRNVPVTDENLTRYFHLMANYKTNVQMKRHTEAFLRGLQCVIPLAWLKMFDPYELNTLISGSSTGFDVADLRRNIVYSGGYEDGSPVIEWLWNLLQHHMSPEDMGRFLMFATSCSRAPLLGFKHLYPKFCIHRVPDSERLPTASTCANLLKLPDYTSFELLQSKLTQAIRAEAGFDLS